MNAYQCKHINVASKKKKRKYCMKSKKQLLKATFSFVKECFLKLSQQWGTYIDHFDGISVCTKGAKKIKLQH
jgi:hypothetical protein